MENLTQTHPSAIRHVSSPPASHPWRTRPVSPHGDFEPPDPRVDPSRLALAHQPDAGGVGPDPSLPSHPRPLGPHFALPLAKVVLLRPDNGPRPHDAVPRDELARRHAVVLHAVEPNERPCAPQPRLAVNGHDARIVLHNLEEAPSNGLRGARPVDKVEVVVGEPGAGELAGVVRLLVEPHHGRDTLFAPYVVIVRRYHRVEARVYLGLGRAGAREGDELRGDDVPVAVLDLLVVLVLPAVKLFEVKVLELLCLVQPSKAVQQRQVEGARRL
mmetsp:Transcript_13871/g.32166  ORF Transcript_13871/g.32166 Transcript_13871/m.32166 type:complete len:272 (-) Transcript_13871:533-1348(-)